VSVVDSVRARLSGDPSRYERAWLTSINVVGVLVVLGVLFDSALLLGSGQTGIFQRALYPLAPPAVTLGVALAAGTRRQVAVSGVALAGYVGVLALVGTLPAALDAAPVYLLVGAVGSAVAVAVGYLWARTTESE